MDFRISGFDGTQYACIENTNEMVTWEQRGLDNSPTLEQAIHCAEDGDKEGVIGIFNDLFGEDNVVVN